MRPDSNINLLSELDETEVLKRTHDINVEFKYLNSTKDSEYADLVKSLAVADNFARRAARDKFQRKNSIIMLIDGKFAGFGIYETDTRASQFYIWQIAITPNHKGKGLAKVLVEKMLNENSKRFPAVVSVYDKNEISLGLFKSLGFNTYQKKGHIYYMTRGGIIDGKEISSESISRVKKLLSISPTNIWNSAKKDWQSEKRKWNELIENAGIKGDIPNPNYASREECLQKNGGLFKFITGESINDGASVLDPIVCETILKLFMPKNGQSVYNPFGGGIQMGFICGFNNIGYLATEIRKNQCDANNAICKASDMNGVEWLNSDSSTFLDPTKKFDLIFSCPPYFGIETYKDYNEATLNQNYDEFKTMIFKGFENAIKMLNENCFFAVMIGDTRDPKTGAYYCMESEIELFLKNQELAIYNKILYLESQFTRAMQTKITIRSRKIPKCDQKIIVAYKGDTSLIYELYDDIGRL